MRIRIRQLNEYESKEDPDPTLWIVGCVKLDSTKLTEDKLRKSKIGLRIWTYWKGGGRGGGDTSKKKQT